jgi:transposase
MSGISKLITNEVVKIAQEKLKELGKNAYISAKLQAVISAKKHGITKVSDVFNISRGTLISWIKHVKNDYVEGLAIRPGRGRKKRLAPEQADLVKEWVNQNSQMTVDELRVRINEEMGLALGRSTVHRIMQSLNFAYITPRPKHHKQDLPQQEVFKKKPSS